MILNKILQDSSIQFTDYPACTMKMGFRTKTFSYKKIYDLSKKIALFLEKQGIQKGDKVLICAPNSPYWISVFWATLLRGAIIVPLNIQSTKEIIQKIADQTEAKILFKYIFFKHELSAGIKQFDLEFIEDLISDFDIKDFKETNINENDIFQIMYTSGTTGDPKGVMLTHKNVSSNLNEISKIIIVSAESDRALSILPLSHIYEQTMGFLLPYWHGVQIIYAHSYSAVRSLMKEYKITKIVAVPEFLHVMMSRLELELEAKNKKNLFDKLLKISKKLNNKYVSKILFYPIFKQLGGKLDTIASGGAPLDADIEVKWRALGVNVLQGYGLTETSPVISTNTFKEQKIGSVGKPLANVDVKIADDKEILVKGPSVFSGYYKNDEKTKAVFTPDGYFKTGDLGEFDKDGYLFINGRKKYMIKSSGGQNVYPEDIEEKLNKNPAVQDSCVLGIEKPHGAVEIHAVLILNKSQNIDVEKIINEVNLQLASFQQIHGFTIWPEIDFPRTATRKIKKDEVRKFVEEGKSKEFKKDGDKKTKLIQLISQITNVNTNQINESTKIVLELHLDSLMRVELVSLIEQNFNVLISESDIKSTTTVKELDDIIKTKKPIKDLPKLRKWPRSWWARILRPILQFLFFSFFRIFVKLRVEGLENLKNLKLPVIFMPNHLSYFDSVVVPMAIPWQIRQKLSFAAARDVLYNYPKYVVAPIELIFNSFPIQRREDENIKLGLDYMGQMLDKGYSFVLYPEGQMSLNGKFQELQRGAGLIATEMDVQIVPMKLIGTEKIVPYGKILPVKRGEVIVKFGKPLKFKRSDSLNLAIEKIHEAIERL